MGVNPAIFESAGMRTEHLVPGSYSRSNSVSDNSGGISAGNGVIMGKSAAGKPGTLIAFASMNDAKDYLISGDLLDGVAHAFNPGGDYSPQRVYAMVVNTNTQSERIMSSGVTEVLSVRSGNYGVLMNQIKMKLSDGSGTGTRKVSVKFKENEIVKDNIAKNSFSVSYTGSASGANISTGSTGITLSAADDATNPEETLSYTFLYEDFPTVEEMVTRINDTGVYTAILLDYTDGAKSAEIDTVSIQVGFNGGITDGTPAVITSNLQALIDALEDIDYIGDVTLVSPGNRIMPQNDSDYVYFTGANAGKYTVAEWAAALEVLETEDVQIISTPSTDANVHMLIANHCVQMSSVENRRERTCILGGAIGESVDGAVLAAKTLSSRLASYCYPYITAADPITGTVKDLPASYFACKLLGLEVALAVAEPLTWKPVKVVAWGKKLKVAELNRLIAGGVLAGGETEDGRLAVIRAMTAYQGNTLQDCERSMVRGDLYMNRDLRMRMSGSVGTTGGNDSASVVSTLSQAAGDWYKSGLLSQPAVFGVNISVSGDKTYLSYSRYQSTPRNFNFITANNFVYSSSGTQVIV